MCLVSILLALLYEQHPLSLPLFTEILSRYDTTNACLRTTTIIPLFNKTITICPSVMHLISPLTAGIVILCIRLKCPYRRSPLNNAITIHLTSSFPQSLDQYAPDATLKYRRAVLFFLSLEKWSRRIGQKIIAIKAMLECLMRPNWSGLSLCQPSTSITQWVTNLRVRVRPLFLFRLLCQN